MSTVLVHLSDIHFRGGHSGTSHDLNTDLRDQLERDAKVMRDRLGAIHGIIVSGDIGFSGKKEDYAIAGKWLDSLCSRLDCPTENVWLVPGNHDVDREIIDKSKIIQALQRDIRSAGTSVDERLRECLYEDKEAGAALFKPLQAYSSFAARYRCEINEARFWWEDNLELNDGSTLRLHGATSTLVSSALDDDGAHRLLLGSAQTLLRQEDGVEHLFVCHHPPDWLQDRDAVEDMLRSRARIQLFGHKHAARGAQIDSSVRLVAGATHPDRAEAAWTPSYNIIVLSVERVAGRRYLQVDWYSRVWSRQDLCFRGELFGSADVRRYSLQLPNWTRPATGSGIQQTEPETRMEPAETSVSQVGGSPVTGGRLVNPARKLTYRFMSLPYQVRLEVAQSLSLIEDEDSDLQEAQRYETYFRRANERGLLEKLWETVERAHGSEPQSENPFVGR